MNDHIKEICKLGQGKECCRYLVAGVDGFECMRITVQGKAMINTRVSTMTAQGDNCKRHTTRFLNQK